MGKASKKSSTKAAAAPSPAADQSAQPQQQPARRSKRDLDPSTEQQQNPYFYVAVFMVIFAFVFLMQISDKIYARYFGEGGEEDAGAGDL